MYRPINHTYDWGGSLVVGTMYSHSLNEFKPHQLQLLLCKNKEKAHLMEAYFCKEKGDRIDHILEK